MRIAFFVAIYPVISETFITRQIAGLADAGHEVVVITGTHHGAAGDDKVRVFTVRPGIAGGVKSGARALASIGSLTLRGLYDRRARLALMTAGSAITRRYTAPIGDIIGIGAASLGDFDAIICHFGPAGVRALYLRDAGLFSGPIATVFHGFDLTHQETVRQMLPHYRSLFERTEALLPISELWKQRLEQWGAPSSKITVLHMGVDLDRYSFPDPDRPLAEPLRVLSVARLVEKKGLEYAIRGCASARTPNTLRIIGAGPLHDMLEDQARLSPHEVTLLGALPHERIFQELENADVFLLPSVVAADGDMEGIPVSLMEAMAMGVVVVTTRHSGIPELVEDGVSGLLAAEYDAGGIADALDRIGSGSTDISGLRTAAYRAVESRFDNARLDAELERIVERLSSTQASRRP